MNRRKFLASSLAAGAAASLAIPAVATAKAAMPTPTFWPIGIYFASDSKGPYTIVVHNVVLTVGCSFHPVVDSLGLVNAKPFLGHAAGTVQLRSCTASMQTSSPTHLARYEFALTPEGWNARHGNLTDAKGNPLYPSADFDRLPWGPTPAEYARGLPSQPAAVKVKPTGRFA